MVRKIVWLVLVVMVSGTFGCGRKAPEARQGVSGTQQALVAATTFVAAGSATRWRYKDDGSNQSSVWRNLSFADGAWAEGPAQLGYGDGDEATKIRCTADAVCPVSSTAKYITSYFRRTFTVANASAVKSLSMKMLRDDGAAVYLNGVEVNRTNLPAGALTNTTPASVVVDGTGETTWTAAVALDPRLLVTGNNVVAVEVHQINASSSDVSFDLELTGTVEDTAPAIDILASAAGGWKYLDTGVDQGTVWRATGFADGAWKVGAAQLGYGDGDEATVVGYGPNASAKYPTTYFRRAFTVTNPAAYKNLLLRLQRDDGAVVSLNGVEIHRSNLPTGTVSFSTLATAAVADGLAEAQFETVSIAPSKLLAGSNQSNVLAVELHQSSATSSDLSFVLELLGEREVPPVAPTGLVATGISATQISLAWTDASSNETGFKIERSADTVVFTALATVPAGTVSFTDTSGLSPGQSYDYRVRATNGGGDSPYSNVAKGTTKNAAPSTGAPAPEILSAAGATWKYLDTGADQGSAWRAANFVDTAWKTGAAPLGYGDEGMATTVGYGANANAKFMTTYFRRGFTVVDPTVYTALTLRLRRDDGVVVFLNGTELTRQNMPTGAVAFATPATTAVGGTDESKFFDQVLPVALLKAGANVLAVEVHQQIATSTDLAFDLELQGTVAARFVARGSDWKYWDRGQDLGTSWRAAGYGDATWPVGPARLGYGGDGEKTTVAFGSNAAAKYPTTYFRRAFTVSDPSAFTGLVLRMTRDDGAVIYLNGTEVTRSNLPTGTIGYGTLATAVIGGADETTFVETPIIGVSTLVSGTNVLAVELHQATLDSSDLGFDVELVGVQVTPAVAPTALVATTISASQINLGWVDNATSEAGFKIYRSLDAVTFSQVATVSANVTNYSDTGLQTGTIYHYLVRAWNGAGDSAPSNQVSASTSGTTAPPPSAGTLVAKGSSWRYLDNGTDQGTGWRAGTFNDSAWKTGQARLGYGDDAELTKIRCTTSASCPADSTTTKYITTYFRKSFTVSSTSGLQSLVLNLLRDDGAVVYLNNTEVHRSNLPTGTISVQSLALAAAAEGSPDEDAFQPSVTLPVTGLISGTNVVAVELHQSSVTSSDLGFDLELLSSAAPVPPPPPAGTLVARGGIWKYLDDGSDQATGWRSTSFSDGAWKVGTAKLGYGDDGEVTKIGYGADANNKFITTYFRKTFTVTDKSKLSSLSVAVLHDDGAVAYLNGSEIYRGNMPAGTIGTKTLASSALGDPTEKAFQPGVNVLPSLLVNGTNVLAVEIHQSGGTSSDVGFDAELMAGGSSGGGPVLTRGPYLQMGSSSSLVVRWRTATSVVGQVSYGTTLGDLRSTAAETAAGTEHVVALTGLLPGTKYYYAIDGVGGTAEGSEYFFVTAPAPGAAKDTRIWVVGDSGTADANAAAVRDAFGTFTGARGADLMLMLGDNAYNTGTDAEYQKAVFDMYPTFLRHTVLWPALGNHESGDTTDATRASPYFNMFTLPTNAEAGGARSGSENYYSFNHGDIHFVSLDSMLSSRAASGAMATWLEQDLSQNTLPWVVAFFHHPPYTDGSHKSDTELQLKEMRQNLVPILEAHNVDLVLSGHSHSYERSYLLNGHYGTSGTLTAAMKKDGGSGRESDTGAYKKTSAAGGANEGAVYAVAGSSGKVSAATLNHPAMFAKLPQLGSVVIDVNQNRLDFKFLRENGRVEDFFTLQKGGATPPPGGQIACAGQPDGTPCNDGNACTSADKCGGGACVAGPKVAGQICEPVTCASGVMGTDGVCYAAAPDPTLLFADTIQATGTDVGSAPGGFKVSQSGQASYSVPIAVPAARGGLTPSLSVGYSSGAGDGLLGVGFNLGGLSEISRCKKTFGRDSEPGPIQFKDGGSEGDAYCLDGQRLILVTGENGAAASEYRTDAATFKRITVVKADDLGDAVDLQGPTAWKVEAKDGSITTYGLTVNARIEGRRALWEANDTDNQPPAARYEAVRLAWGAARIEDRSGNRIEFKYTQEDQTAEGGAQEMVPQEIQYNARAGEPGNRSVRFRYMTLAAGDQRERFVAGLKLKRTKVISQIDVAAPNPVVEQIVRSFVFSYERDALIPGDGGRAHIKTLKECDGDPTASAPPRPVVCKRETTLKWQPYGGDFTRRPTGVRDTRLAADSPNWRIKALDVDNDGREDLVYQVGRKWVWRRTIVAANGTVSLNTDATPIVTDGADLLTDRTADLVFADLDQDGKTDLVVTADGATYRGTGPGTFQLKVKEDVANGPAITKATVVADLSGDGKAEVIRPARTGRWLKTGVTEMWTAATPEEMKSCAHDVGTTTADPWNQYTVDLDGDGRAEMLTRRAADPNLPTTTPAGARLIAVNFTLGSAWIGRRTTLLAATPSLVNRYFFFDHNGDGLPDVLSLDNGSPGQSIALNTGALGRGEGFEPPVRQSSLPAAYQTLVSNWAGTNDPGYRIFDYNLDGRDDVLLVDDGAPRNGTGGAATRTNLAVLLSTPAGLVKHDLTIPVGMYSDGTASPGAGFHNYLLSQLADLNGDGLEDYFQVENDEVVLYVRNGWRPNMLIGVEDGMGVKEDLTYKPLVDPSVYAPGTNCVYPTICAKRGPWVVSEHRVDNGIGAAQNRTQFTYADARVDLQGSGWLGFRTRLVTHPETRTTIQETFDNLTEDKKNGQVLYPYVGLTKSREIKTMLDNGWVRQRNEDNDYELVDLNDAYPDKRILYVRPTIVAEEEWEYDDALPTAPATARLRRVETTFGYKTGDEKYGTVDSQASVSRSSSNAVLRTDTVAITYQHDEARWLFGLPVRTTYTSAMADGTQVVRTTANEFDPTTGLVAAEITEPDTTDQDLRLELRYQRLATGQVRQVEARDLTGKVRRTQVTYDPRDHVFPRTYQNSLGHVTTVYTHPALGQEAVTADANGAKVVRQFDGFGRLRLESLPGGAGAIISYARSTEPGSVAADRRYTTVMTTKPAGGGEYREITNRLGHVLQHQAKNLDGTFSYVAMSHDEKGRLTSKTRPQTLGQAPAFATSYAYDNLGRSINVTRPDESALLTGGTVSSTAAYDGRTSTYTDEVGHVRKVTMGDMGMVETTVQVGPSGAIPTTYVYGPFGVLKTVTRKTAAGTRPTVTQLDYDFLGRRTEMIDPDTGTNISLYNAFGEVKLQMDGNAAATRYDYDDVGRPNTKVDVDGTTRYTWDKGAFGVGYLSEASSPSDVTTKLAYDAAGRVKTRTQMVGGVGYSVDQAYDSAGRLDTIAYPGTPTGARFTVKRSYDGDSGELSKVTNAATGLKYWEVTARNASGQLLGETFGNGTSSQRGYHGQTGRLAMINTTRVEAGVPRYLQAQGYDYHGNGSLKAKHDGVSMDREGYEYDELDRLKRWFPVDAQGAPVANGWQVAYGHDDLGNLSSRIFTPGTATGGGTAQTLVYEYAQGTRKAGPHAVTKSAWGDYGYDLKGNQVTRPGGETVSYTAFDLPKKMGGSRNVTFAYDAFGQRAQKQATEGSTTRTTVYASELYEKRMDGASTEHVYYVTGAERTVAQVVRPYLGTSAGAEKVRYLHGDRQGTVQTVTDEAGVALDTVRTDPYGNRITNFNQPVLPVTSLSSDTPRGSGVRLGYTEHEQDEELGLVNMRGRIFDPRLGRFLTADPKVQSPMVGASYNRYLYGFGNPLKYTDPSGYASKDGNVLPGGEAGNDCPPESILLSGTCKNHDDAVREAESKGKRLLCDNGECVEIVLKCSQAEVTAGVAKGACDSDDFAENVNVKNNDKGQPELAGAGGLPDAGPTRNPEYGNGGGEPGNAPSTGGGGGGGGDGGTGPTGIGFVAAPNSGWARAVASLASAAHEVHIAASAVGVLAMAAALAFIKGDTSTKNDPRFGVKHYTSEEGRAGILQAGQINPSQDGKVYLTIDDYSSGTEARERLALANTPTGYFRIPFESVADIGPPARVAPSNSEPGGGTEFTVPRPVSVDRAHWVPIGR